MPEQHIRLDLWVRALLLPRLILDIEDSSVGESFNWNGQLFHKYSSTDSSVFFDRITDDVGHLLGFEVIPARNEAGLISSVQSLDYTEVVGGDAGFRFYFARAPQASRLHADQGFGGGIYRSWLGNFGLVIPAYFLDSRQIEDIRQRST